MISRAAIHLAVFLGGGIIGWTSIRNGSAQEKDGTPFIVRTGRPALPGPNLDKLFGRLQDSKSPQGPFAVLLPRWSEGELRAALEDSLKQPDTVLSPLLAIAVFREYVRRDTDAALDWFGGLDILHQKVFIQCLSEDSRSRAGGSD